MADGNRELIAIYKENSFSLDIKKTTEKQFFYDQNSYESSQANPFDFLFHFGFTAKKAEMSPSLKFLHSFAAAFIKEITQTEDMEINRTAPKVSDELISGILLMVPYAVGAEFIDARWVRQIWTGLGAVFQEKIADYPGSVEEFLREYDNRLNIAGRVFFHLVENKSNEEYPFAFLATYSTAGKEGKKAVHMPLKNALQEFKEQEKELLVLLSTVSKAAERSDFISQLVESGELFSPLKFAVGEAYVFLKEIPVYEECGILCRIPDWWKKKSNSIRVSVSVGDKAPSKVGLDSLLSFVPELFLGEEQLSREELERLLSEAAGLTMIKGKWVEVDHERLQEILAVYESAENLAGEGDLTLAEAMRAQLTLQKELGAKEQDPVLEVTNGTWLQGLRERLLNPGELERLEVGEAFQAVLRSYQQTGFDWLHLMKELGFGALLADDMGLGKTLQILALLEYLRQQEKPRTLLILPASLIGNWQNEIQKFAPLLQYKLLHTSMTGAAGKLAEEPLIGQEDVDLYITTYGMAVRLEELRNYQWDLVILDEAQAIKNPGTKQTKAIKQINAHTRIAMTGTPIENRLSDLWSIFDFLNQGLLGTAKEFSGLMKKETDYYKLRTVVNPFILRRLKTDKSIISDLPDKVEMNAYTALTKKQLVLYKALVRELEKSLQESEGIQRKGLVLASIMKFKQICNHPAQYLGQEEYDHELSGKFEKLRELCETIYEKRERVLIFTQFKEMTQPLADFLEMIFERKGLVLHGGTPVKKRGELVERFNGEEYVPFMVLSLKAGGVGLNLTAANHVIHFDRWWNPAVENQATDRAFRIGQQKNVMVHKFITKGTIEERIDEMIAEKQKLAQDIIEQSGESWITELSNEELMKMFQLF